MYRWKNGKALNKAFKAQTENSILKAAVHNAIIRGCLIVLKVIANIAIPRYKAQSGLKFQS